MLNNLPLLSAVAALAVILAGLFVYLITIDRKLRKLEKKTK
jgi:CcmD family protein